MNKDSERKKFMAKSLSITFMIIAIISFCIFSLKFKNTERDYIIAKGKTARTQIEYLSVYGTFGYDENYKSSEQKEIESIRSKYEVGKIASGLVFLVSLVVFITDIVLGYKKKQYAAATSYSGYAGESALTRINRENQEEKERKDIANGTKWVCSNCKKVNPKYVTTCVCGKEKPDKLQVYNNVNAHDIWECVKCGNHNTNHIVLCKCGMKKSENDKLIEQEKKIDEKQSSESELKSELERLDILKKYKELLDVGAITEEEFEKKKKEVI